MEKKQIHFSISAVICAVLICACLIACSIVFVNGYVSVKSQNGGNGITATGSASCDFESNLIVWRGRFSASAYTTEEAYNLLKQDAGTIRNYLEQNGVSTDETVFSAIDISTQTNPIYNEEGNYVGDEFAGYLLDQTVTVTSSDVNKVEKISRDITELLASGVQFTSNSPEYYYTELDTLKLQLVEAATQNAKDRIDLMAAGSGASLGKLTSSNLGVFQITAQNSGEDEYSYGGAYNIYSRYKTASITVRLNYAVN